MSEAKRFQLAMRRIGQDMTLRQRSETYNSSTGKTATVLTDDTFKGVMTKISESLINGTTVVFGDRKVTVAALDLAIVPNQKDHVKIGTNFYTVEQIEPVVIKGTTVAYELQVRGS